MAKDVLLAKQIVNVPKKMPVLPALVDMPSTPLSQTAFNVLLPQTLSMLAVLNAVLKLSILSLYVPNVHLLLIHSLEEDNVLEYKDANHSINQEDANNVLMGFISLMGLVSLVMQVVKLAEITLFV